MQDSRQRIRPASIAAFLFLPQFRLSFQHFSFIMPVFIRTLAVMFEQAGLLPKGHPATMYGVEGIKKYGFFELMGEAWYTLRKTNASPMQWAFFSAAVLMIVFTVLSFVTTMMQVAGMFVGTASAQIFDAMPGKKSAMEDIVAAPKNLMFDKSVPLINDAHSDYAIMILDKVLRLAATGKGGPLQDGLASLMYFYNTGMLVIAGIMLFWSVLSIVLDTAKTGHLGGGRHNMVWAPIRIVVGLGLLIPFGTNGFNSGQFLVLKLAEWGSNFGTRGWVEYVARVSKDSKIVSKADMDSAASIANQFARMWVCRIAYNGYNNQTNITNAKQRILENRNQLGKGGASLSYTNFTTSNLCGTVTFPIPNDPVLTASANNGGDPLLQAQAQYKLEIYNSLAKLFMNDRIGTTIDSGLATPEAKKFACSFASMYFPSVTNGEYPLKKECNLTGPVGSTMPGDSMQPLINEIIEPIRAANDSAFRKLEALGKGDTIVKDVANRGWAGMGMWYHRIAELNTTSTSAQVWPITFSVGNALTQSNVINTAKAAVGGARNQIGTVQDIDSRYAQWWRTASVPGVDVGKNAASESLYSALMSGDSFKIVTALANSVSYEIKERVGFAFGGTGDIDLYPLALLSKLGNQLVVTALTIYTAITAAAAILAIGGGVSVLGTGVEYSGTLGVALMHSPIMGLFSTLAGSLFGAGILLAYWIPMLPFIRVAFAVLAWIMGVFEAVAMVPIAALTHISTEGEGVGGQVRNVWIMWLNVLLRPILTVIGYVGAMLVFNTFVVFLSDAFFATKSQDAGNGFLDLLGHIVYPIIYVGIIYTAANGIFKMVDMIPHAITRYMGGHADTTLDDGGAHFASAAAGGIGSFAGAAQQYDRRSMKENRELRKSANSGGVGNATQNPPGGGGS